MTASFPWVKWYEFPMGKFQRGSRVGKKHQGKNTHQSYAWLLNLLAFRLYRRSFNWKTKNSCSFSSFSTLAWQRRGIDLLFSLLIRMPFWLYHYDQLLHAGKNWNSLACTSWSGCLFFTVMLMTLWALFCTGWGWCRCVQDSGAGWPSGWGASAAQRGGKPWVTAI